MKWVVTMVVLLSLAGPIAALEETQTQTPGMLLQQAIYAERTEGDLDKAIGIYEKVVMASKESRRILALAVFRLGSCHAKKGQPDLAQMHFERIVEEFSEYATLVNRASRELDRLKPKEPAPAINKTVLLFDSLEQGKDRPDGWDKQGDVPGVKYIWDMQVASEGKASLCLHKTVDGHYPIAQWVRSIEHTSQDVRLMVSAMVQADGVAKATLDVLFLDKDGEWIKHEWVAYIGPKKAGRRPFTHSWELYSGQVDIPENTRDIVVGLQMYGPGRVWFDEIEVAYVPRVIEPIKPMSDLEIDNLMGEAWQLFRTQTNAEAQAKFEIIVQQRPALASAYQGLAWAQLNGGKKLNAVKTFEKCLSLDPKNAAALNGLGWIAYTDKKYDEAISLWDRGVTVSNGSATACLAGLTRVYMEQKDYDQAIKYYNVWLKVNPADAQARDGLNKATQAKKAL